MSRFQRTSLVRFFTIFIFFGAFCGGYHTGAQSQIFFVYGIEDKVEFRAASIGKRCLLSSSTTKFVSESDSVL